MERHKLAIYVCLLLEKNNKILLLKRANTGWMDGFWHVPGGSLEPNESVTHAVIREGYEELGIVVDHNQVKLVHVMHLGNNALGFYFLAQEWQAEPYNKEPDKASDIQWFSITALPTDISPYARKAIETLSAGVNYTFFE